MSNTTRPKKKAPTKKLGDISSQSAADAEDDHDSDWSNTALQPQFNAAAVIEPFSEKVFGKLDFVTLAAELKVASESLIRNDLSRCEEMLFSQAHTLQALFTYLARKASVQGDMGQYEIFMRVALKAQSQCRATLETLAAIKNPTAPTFVKQANIANGPQQVNNGGDGAPALPSRTRGKTQNTPNELLEVTHEQGQWLDASTTQGAIRAHSTMEAVAAVHRSEDGRGKGGC